MNSIAIIDDEPGILEVMRDIFEDQKYKVFTAADGAEGIRLIENNSIDLVFLDIWMPGKGGIEILQEIKQDFPDIEVVIISGHATIEAAVKTVKLGAYDCIEKPLDMSRILTIARNAIRMKKLRYENRILRSGAALQDEIIGSTPEILRVRELIAQSAPSDSRVMILGENGTGKELVARKIHNSSSRAMGPFIEVNCAAIPDSLIESELFGHEKGAFTGAVARRHGKFEIASGGTLFLDEVADLSLEAQSKMLRAVQEMTFQRLGGEKPVTVDVRIICATNKDIQAEVQAKRFREDLYFRLNVIPIVVPSLRDRTDDLSALIGYFIPLLSENREAVVRFSEEAMEILRRYSWPGNIRELKNFIERITILADETEVSKETAAYYLGEVRVESSLLSYTDDYMSMKLVDAREQFEKKIIEQRLQSNGFNIAQTAQSFGIYPSNLHGRIKKLGIEIEK